MLASAKQNSFCPACARSCQRMKDGGGHAQRGKEPALPAARRSQERKSRARVVRPHDVEKARDRRGITQVVEAEDQRFGELVGEQHHQRPAQPAPQARASSPAAGRRRGAAVLPRAIRPPCAARPRRKGCSCSGRTAWGVQRHAPRRRGSASSVRIWHPCWLHFDVQGVARHELGGRGDEDELQILAQAREQCVVVRRGREAQRGLQRGADLPAARRASISLFTRSRIARILAHFASKAPSGRRSAISFEEYRFRIAEHFPGFLRP
jgi:hypothetical protein